jgi:hypothetical protein
MHQFGPKKAEPPEKLFKCRNLHLQIMRYSLCFLLLFLTTLIVACSRQPQLIGCWQQADDETQVICFYEHNISSGRSRIQVLQPWQVEQFDKDRLIEGEYLQGNELWLEQNSSYHVENDSLFLAGLHKNDRVPFPVLKFNISEDQQILTLREPEGIVPLIFKRLR